MKLYRCRTKLKLAPFGDDIRGALVGGQTLEQAQAEAARHCDLQVEDASGRDPVPPGGDFLVMGDDLYVSRACLRRFLQTPLTGKGVWRLALKRGPASDYCLPLQKVDADEQQVGFDLYRVRGAQVPRGLSWPHLRHWLAERAQALPLEPGGSVESLTLSRPGPPRLKLELPRSLCLAVQLSHWVHLLWLNHLLPWLRLHEYWQDRGTLTRAWHGRGRNPHRREARLNVIGPGCSIHPTARVEGSWLGRGVKLGPFAYVRESILGDGVEVADHSKFTRCVVGAGCHTLNDSLFVSCTFYPDSTLASFLLRNSVIGRRVFLTSGVMFWDEPIQGTVTVRHGDTEVDTSRYLLGGCAGHECLLGTRAIFLPGRAVPNQTIIVMRPEEGVVKLPEQASPGQPHIYHQGRIVPLTEVLPQYSPAELEP